MKVLVIFSIVFLHFFTLDAQDFGSVKNYLTQGVNLHDSGDFEGAIEKFDMALELEKNNLTALAEKALTLMSLKKYKEAIKTCQQAVKTNPESPGLRYVFTTYANALDMSGKPKKALEIYDEGIAMFPDDNQLQFNKGIALSGLPDYDAAILSFQKSSMLKPTHASSHNAIGRLQYALKNDIPTLMALCRFLIIEPEGNRAVANLELVQEIMGGNVEQTGENNITINIDPSQMSDPSNKDKVENDFSVTNLILQMSAALDFEDKNKDKSEMELFMGKFETICSSLSEVQEGNFGFYWEYYAPYFIELKEKDHMETFSNLIFASSGDEEVIGWLNENSTKLDAFYTWSTDYIWPTR